MSENNRRRGALTRAEFRRLRQEIAAWQVATSSFRHATQIARLTEQFSVVAEDLDARCDPKHEAEKDDGAFALHCAETDEMLAGFRQVFTFYRDRMAQRNDDLYKPILDGADEILWSCFRPMFGDRLDHTPPLTFLDSTRATHWAWESIKPLLAELRAAALPPILSQSTPVPFIGLPFWTTSAPWSLVLVAHEVGHHVFRDCALEEEVETVVRTAAAKRGLAPEAQTDWALRSNEIFADLFSVAAMGVAAVETLMIIVRGPSAALVKGNRQYPPAAARLSMMTRFADLRVGRKVDLGDLAWAKIDPDAAHTTIAKLADDIAAAADEKKHWFVPAIRDFEDEVDALAKQPDEWGDRRSAGRLHGAALHRAWTQLPDDERANPEAYVPKLKKHLEWLVANAEAGSRSGGGDGGGGNDLLAALRKSAGVEVTDGTEEG